MNSCEQNSEGNSGDPEQKSAVIRSNGRIGKYARNPWTDFALLDVTSRLTDLQQLAEISVLPLLTGGLHGLASFNKGAREVKNNEFDEIDTGFSEWVGEPEAYLSSCLVQASSLRSGYGLRYGFAFRREIISELRAAHAFQVVVNTYRVCCESPMS